MTLSAVDIFCGAGGWSHGWRIATGTEPMVAVNHCAHAVHLHQLNHPATEHHLKDVWEVDPKVAIGGRRVDWLHGSPDCTHHSRAKGGKPREQHIRALADVLIGWIRHGQPRVFSLENVTEWLDWGPLDHAGQPIKSRKGELFREWLGKLQALGYVVDWRVLCAADFGAPTIRKRLFLVARRDGGKVRWPTPTHGRGTGRSWRGAWECIDWAIPVPSIFARRKPLATKTCQRIAAGIVRHVIQKADDAFAAPASMQGDVGTRMCSVWIAKHYGGVVGNDARDPLGTITAKDHHALVAVTAFGKRARECAAFLTSYYSGGGTSSDLRAPMPTVVTHDRHGLVLCRYWGESLAICDIGMRMLAPRELARAQGFPDSFVLEGAKAQQVARIGNSVETRVAAALVRANLGTEIAVA